jgi:hypothetical protein
MGREGPSGSWFVVRGARFGSSASVFVHACVTDRHGIGVQEVAVGNAG